MPNNVKNRIELHGSAEQIENLIKEFSTHHEKKLCKAHDGSIICNNKDGQFKGWYDEINNEFKYASKRDEVIKGLPENIEYSYDDSFIQMPDFNKIIPMPEELHITSDGWISLLENEFSNETIKSYLDRQKSRKEYKYTDREGESIDNFCQGIKNYLKYGSASWYGWAVKNWGTKWNSYSCEKEADNIFTFETAWSGVPNLIKEISIKYPNVKIIYEFSDEDTGCNCGVYEFHKGLVSENILKNSSIEAYELYFKLRPEDKKYYKFVDGHYEYIED